MSSYSRTSYAGSHRSPASPNRPARALLGVTAAGAVVVAPLAMASPAQAASGRTWDRLAQCESGGNWSINTGNGYRGGLQFSSSTWRAFGGSGSANNASRSTQITVAERVLAAQGWGAWPACSRKLGLSGSDAAGSPRVSRSSERSVSTHKATTHKATTHQAAKKAAKKTVTSRKANVRSSTSSSSRGTRGAYVVRSGDTLSKIAARQHISGGWHALYAQNRGEVGSNPNLIFVGQQLLLPR